MLLLRRFRLRTSLIAWLLCWSLYWPLCISDAPASAQEANGVVEVSEASSTAFENAGEGHDATSEAASSDSGQPVADETLTSLASFSRYYGRTDIEKVPVDLTAHVVFWDYRNASVFIQDQYDAIFVQIPLEVFDEYRTVPPGTAVRVRGDLVLDGHYFRADQVEILDSQLPPPETKTVHIDELSLGSEWSKRVHTEGVLNEVAYIDNAWYASLWVNFVHFQIQRFEQQAAHSWQQLIGDNVSINGALDCAIGPDGNPLHYVIRQNEHDPQLTEAPTSAPSGQFDFDPNLPLSPLTALLDPDLEPGSLLRVKTQITSAREGQGYLVEADGAGAFLHSRLAFDWAKGRLVELIVELTAEGHWQIRLLTSQSEAQIPPPALQEAASVRASDFPFRAGFKAELVSISTTNEDLRTLVLRDGQTVFSAVGHLDDETWHALDLASAQRVYVGGLVVAPEKQLGNDPDQPKPEFVVQLAGANSVRVIARWWQLSTSVVISVLAALAVIGTIGMICFALLWLRVQRTDRTNQRLAAELLEQQKLDAIGRLAGGVAHDFNNLLVGIGSNLELIQLDPSSASPQIQQCLRAARRCTNQATKLVRSLLGFSRRAELELQVGDLNRVIEEATLLVKTTLDPKIEVSLDLSHDLPACRFDYGQMEQVLLNLCFNARDAIGNSGGRITIRTEKSIAGDRTPVAMITVRDNGAGMDPATISRIFEPFFTTKELGEGTGLGLSSAYGVIEQHGGTIDCHSERGVGTVFKITLPFAADKQDPLRLSGPAQSLPQTLPTAQDEPSAATNRAARVRASKNRWHVLLVDDDDDVRRATRLVLETLGHHVTTAADGLEAIGQLERGLQPDLVILDLVMPAISGVETFGLIKATYPNLPIVVCSGLLAEAEKLRRQDGPRPDACLAKPFELADLRATIERVMDDASGPAQAGPSRTSRTALASAKPHSD